MVKEKDEYTAQMNTKIPENLRKDAQIGAINLGMKLQRWVAGAFRIQLYFQENLTRDENSKLAKTAYPLVCLHVARNDLAKQGYDTAGLDSEIKKAEEFLQQ